MMGPGRGRPPMGPGGPPDWGPPHPDWGPPHPGWGPPGDWPHPEDWPPPPGGWGPRGPPPPEFWGPRGPPPPDWDPRGPPGWGPHPDDWPPPDWGPEEWRREEQWRRWHEECRARDGWGPPGPMGPLGPPEPLGPPGPWDRPPGPWGPEPMPPPGLPPPVVPPIGPLPPGLPHPGVPPPDLPPVGMPPQVLPPPDCPPPFGLPGIPPPGWSAEPLRPEELLNPPPDQPAWIKALISAPTDSTAPEIKKNPEDTFIAPPPPGTEPPPKPAKTKKPKKTKTISKPMGLLGKRPVDKPLPGRSIGIISFIGPSFGHIEREDLEKFTFSFNAFFGNPKAMTPGVRVHFTAVNENNTQIATDIKVAPGGTENVDSEIYEAVVSQPIVEPGPGERQYPGQVYVTIGQLRTNVSFEKKDSNVSLLKDDHVLMNLLTDIVTNKRRATNIRPKIPDTFSQTGETRETGVILSFKGTTEGLIKCEAHGEIPFDVKENFSDVEFSEEDINEEVEFTIITLRAGKRAIRIRRVKEPLLLTLCSVTTEKQEVEEEEEDDEEEEEANVDFSNMPLSKTKDTPLSNFELDPELYEGIVSQPIIEPSASLPGYPGQIHANIGPVKTNVTFDHRDCGVTLLKNDHVLINLLVDKTNNKRRATNIKPKIPFTFSYTKEKRELGIVTKLGPEEGIVNSEEHGEIPFDKKENFSDSEFSSTDIHKEVEFTLAQVKMKKRAIRLRRTKRIEDKILEEQKRRRLEEEQQRRQEMERRKRELERRKQEEEERRLETEKKKKEEVAAALAAARDKWTPLGFMMRGADPGEDLSKDRFDGTVLKAISKHPPKDIKKEPEEPEMERAQNGTPLLSEVEVKVKKEEESEETPAEGEQKEKEKEEEGQKKVKEEKKDDLELKPDSGLLVMTIDGQQKKIWFGRKDLVTHVTMMVGDKVRFNIATHRETKEERATYVELLADSFEESIEERQMGIVIEFSANSGLIKCSQSPQLYFHMSEVIEKKRLELNEKVEFSIVPHETVEGEHQAIRIKRYAESMFLPGRKLAGVNAIKSKLTIKLQKPSEEEKKSDSDKLKAVVKNLRSQDSKRQTNSRKEQSKRYSRSRSRSRSPERDKFGRLIKKRRSSSTDRHRRSHSRERSKKRSRSRSRDRSRRRSKSSSSSRSRSRSRSRERSKERVKKAKYSHEREEYRRRPELNPRAPRRMDDELARKKRELEELNEMIRYKKAMVDPRAVDPGQRTCIDYDHGRIAVPVKEFAPVRPMLKDEPEYHRPKPYGDPYYDRDFSPFGERRYSDPFAERYSDPYYDRPYSERPVGYEVRTYPEPSYAGPSARPYTDRYDVYDQPYESRYHEHKYSPERAHPNDPYRKPSANRAPPPQQNPGPSGPPFRPPSPDEPPPKSPSPKSRESPTVKPPLDRFLDMLNKKKSAPEKTKSPLKDDLLPHERALQEGSGFSRIVGLSQEQPSSSTLAQKNKLQSPKPVEDTSKAEPYNKIQSLLRTIGLKLGTDDVSKLRAQSGTNYSPKSSSLERDIQREDQRPRITSSEDSDRFHSPLARKSSNEYESFLDQQELEAFRKAQQMQSLTRSISGGTPPPKPPPGPPPAQYQRPPVPDTWDIHTPPAQTNPNNQPSNLEASKNPPGPPPGPPPRPALSHTPPGPPPGPPPRRPAGQPPFISAPTHQSLPFLGQTSPQSSSSAEQASSQTDSGISNTVARCLQVIETVRSLTVQPAAKPTKSVQFNLPTESNSHSAIKSEEDIKNMQKEKLDLYNQRILEKRDQDKRNLVVARKTQDKNKDGPLVSPAKPLTVEQKNVWICGHSLIYWAESRAKSPEVGMQLGMNPSRVNLWWKGTQGMTWSQLLPQLHQLKVLWPNPDALIIHLGGNDLNDSPTDLLAAVRRDLTSIRNIFPRCLLVWSHILPRRAWRHSTDSLEVELVRTTVNRRIHSVLSELGGVSLPHDNIRCGANTGLYRADGVHLSPKGIDVFNLNLQDFLEKWDQEVN